MKLIVILVVALVLLIIVGLIIRNRQLRAIIAGSGAGGRPGRVGAAPAVIQ